MRHSTLILCGVVFAAMALAGCQSETRDANGPALEAVANAKTARFQAVIYETHLPAERVGKLDATSLAAADDLQAALAPLGETTLLYSVDQTVSLAKDSITIGKRVPLVTGSRTAQGGGTVNMVRYEEVGAMFQVSGEPAAGGLAVAVEVEMSTVTDSQTKIADTVQAPAVRNVKMGHKGPIEPGRPVVITNTDAATRDADGNAIACVCRIVFSELKP